MSDFIPILVAAMVLMVVLMIVFGGMITPSKITSSTVFSTEDFLISSSTTENQVTRVNGTVEKGIISGADKEISFSLTDTDVSTGIMKLRVDNTNLYGALFISLNGNVIYNDFARIGNHTFMFDGDILKGNNVLQIKADSSGWKFWAPTVYIFDLNLSADYIGRRNEYFYFDVPRLDLASAKYAKLIIDVKNRRGNDMIVLINNNEVFKGTTDTKTDFSVDILNAGRNKVEFFTEVNSNYNVSSAQIVLYP